MVEVSIQVDRMSAHIRKAWDLITPKLHNNIQGTIHFTYLINEDIKLELGPNDFFYRLIRRQVYSQFADKGNFPKILKKYGIGNLAPQTCYSVEQALAKKDIKVWFSKDRHGTAGKGMQCLRNTDLPNYALPKNNILQAQIDDICLINDRKFTSRIYVLVWNEGVYLFDDGFHVIHGVPYDPLSTDYDVQINHAGYQNADGAVEIKPFDTFQQMNRFRPVLERLVTDLVPALHGLRAASSKSEYIFLGIDVMLKRDSTVQIVEVNAVPNFVHTTEINQLINVPFVTAAIGTMVGQKSRRLKQVA